jgi:hypothetical protein
MMNRRCGRGPNVLTCLPVNDIQAWKLAGPTETNPYAATSTTTTLTTVPAFASLQQVTIAA